MRAGARARAANVRHDRRHVGSAVLVWMDLEMTGLDPARARDRRDRHARHRRRPRDRGRGPRPRRPPAGRGARRDGRRRARRCTPAAGCCTRSRRRRVTLEEAGAATLDVPQGARPRAAHGAAVRQLDRHRPPLPRRHLPEIEDYLHYRSVDVSTIKELARRWYPGRRRGRPARPAPTAPSTTSARASTSCATTASTSSSRSSDPPRRSSSA